MINKLTQKVSLYTILSFLQVVISFVNLFFLYQCFGKSNITAVYFITTTIIGSILLILITLTDQFVYHYLNIKLNSDINANVFFNSTILISIIIGATFGFILYCQPFSILNIFAKDLSFIDKSLAVSLIETSCFIIFTFSGCLNLIQSKLNVDGKIILSYFMSLLPLFFQLLAWLFLYFKYFDILFIFRAQSLGIIIAIIVFLISYWKEFNFRISFNKEILLMISDSVKIRTAHNVHNFFLNYIISNTLAGSNPLVTSIFFTIKRLFEAIQQILVGPIQKTFPSLIRNGVESSILLIKNYFKTHIKSSYSYLFFSIFFALLCFLVLFLSPFASFFEGHYTFLIFSTFCYILITFTIYQEIPFTLLIMSQSKSSVIYKSNILFLLQLYVIVKFVNVNIREYLLVGSILFGQLIILINNRFSANKLILNLKLK